jgi:hypothetical protein
MSLVDQVTRILASGDREEAARRETKLFSAS